MTNDIEKEVEGGIEVMNTEQQIAKIVEDCKNGYEVIAVCDSKGEVEFCQSPFGTDKATASIMAIVERIRKGLPLATLHACEVCGTTMQGISERCDDCIAKNYISREEVARCFIHRNELNSMLAIKQKDYETLNQIILNIPNYYILKSDHEKALADMGEEVLKIAKETATNVQKEFNKQETELRNKTLEECKRHLLKDEFNCLDFEVELDSIKSQPAMKLFTAEEAYEKSAQVIEEYAMRVWHEEIKTALKQAFGIKGKEINT